MSSLGRLKSVIKPLAETEVGSGEDQPSRDKLIHVQPYKWCPDLDSLKPDRGFFITMPTDIMQIEEAQALRRKWKEQGDEPCQHPSIDKEYYRGMHTMEYVCMICGEEFSIDEKRAIEQNRSK